MARVPENGFCIPPGVICLMLRDRVGPDKCAYRKSGFRYPSYR